MFLMPDMEECLYRAFVQKKNLLSRRMNSSHCRDDVGFDPRFCHRHRNALRWILDPIARSLFDLIRASLSTSQA